MKRISLFLVLSLAFLLSACAPNPPKDDGTLDVAASVKSVHIPAEQLLPCAPLPMLELRPYTENELIQVLNTWVTSHESCASGKLVLINTIKGAAGKKIADK